MYMTRMELDPCRRDTVRALASPGMFHGAIESAFPGERRRRLWRVDELNGRSYLLLVSGEEPDLTRAAEQFAPPGAGWETKNYQPFLNALADGGVWRFRLAANPTISAPSHSQARGKVYAHVTAAQQKNWLLTRAEKHGFSLSDETFDITRRGVLSFRKEAQQRPVTLGVCVFEGLLTVTDALLLRKALTEGIGRGKAYGQGMMTLVRA